MHVTDLAINSAMGMRRAPPGSAHILELPETTGQYLLTHYPRELRFLCEQLDTLDRASLVEQRKLTIPFIKSVLNPAI